MTFQKTRDEKNTIKLSRVSGDIIHIKENIIRKASERVKRQ